MISAQKFAWRAAGALGALGMASTAQAQAIDAGDYVPAPSGTQLGSVDKVDSQITR